MESAVTAVFEVLNFGAIIILVVLGLGVIAGMMGIFNFAHGEFVLLGAYWVYLFDEWKLPVWLGMLTAPVVVAADRRLAVAAGGATVLIEDPSPLPLVCHAVPRSYRLGIFPSRSLGHGASFPGARLVTPVLRHRAPFR